MIRTRGRPRSFDREQALQLAMQVFWSKGYEGTTMADLTEAIGVKAPSLYAAFGDKNALFREAVDVYSRTVSAEPLRELQAGRGIREDLCAMLRASVRMYSGKHGVPGLPAGKGCMVVISAINCAPENAEHSDALSQRRHKRRNEIRARLLQAQREGEIRADADVTALGDFYTSFLNGLALGARDGVSAARLAATLEHAMLPLEHALVVAGKRKGAARAA
ncbi:TetR/AcrR family transcriptional regulator [Herbaspirillum robiniae]|uniref:TetR family transcriptional regulator n=1 Tax=Herbaspirillum robiniae TaxID=2014887 RepID=A0A246WNU2_9BURK|nr:TetR/AcrR family transcriptional regulator [Herbaspirillum robiniae]NUU04470.1 TetR/AcrR family transcriptional regulator [Herbaspirillum robiniae]OWY28038.1 TetR family transcriptional regulator [Herbaspirillum robiniae]